MTAHRTREVGIPTIRPLKSPVTSHATAANHPVAALVSGRNNLKLRLQY